MVGPRGWAVEAALSQNFWLGELAGPALVHP